MAFSFVKCLSNSLSDVTKGYYLWCLRILFETPMSGRFRSQNDPTSARHRECIYSRCYITFRTSASRRYNVGGRCYIAFPTSASRRDCVGGRCYIARRTSASRRYNVGGSQYVAFQYRRRRRTAAVIWIRRRREIGNASGLAIATISGTAPTRSRSCKSKILRDSMGRCLPDYTPTWGHWLKSTRHQRQIDSNESTSSRRRAAMAPTSYNGLWANVQPMSKMMSIRCRSS
jgi:hypothetical protein